MQVITAVPVVVRAMLKWNGSADEYNQWDALGREEKLSLLNSTPMKAGDNVHLIESGIEVTLIKEETPGNWKVLIPNKEYGVYAAHSLAHIVPEDLG